VPVGAGAVSGVADHDASLLVRAPPLPADRVEADARQRQQRGPVGGHELGYPYVTAVVLAAEEPVAALEQRC